MQTCAERDSSLPSSAVAKLLPGGRVVQNDKLFHIIVNKVLNFNIFDQITQANLKIRKIECFCGKSEGFIGQKPHFQAKTNCKHFLA
jgi:hypothetical protein